MYADDILLLAPSVCELQNLLLKCEAELTRIGMSVNAKSHAAYASAHDSLFHVPLSEQPMVWNYPLVSEIRYL
jgi:hypothetical protein